MVILLTSSLKFWENAKFTSGLTVDTYIFLPLVDEPLIFDMESPTVA